MRFKINIFIAALFIALLAHESAAQVCQVSGTIVDSEDKSAISGASIAYSINGKELFCTTKDNGKFSFELPQGKNTTIKVTHLGYKPMSKLVIGKKNSISLKLELIPESSMLGELVVKSKIPLAIQRGDTTIYRTKDFKVNEDANMMDLMQKIPGAGMVDGKLEVHGQQVKEITVDGRKYFESDISMAMKNLKAEVIEEIQIYDQLSEYAKLTGFDDGNTTKTINLKTKKGTSKSDFGKFTTGVGIDDVYKIYGMNNLFREDLRWTVFTQCNNINEQNFSMIDLLSSTGTASSSAPSQSPYSKGSSDNFHPTANDDISSMMVDVSDYGVTTSQAVGTNFSDEWMKGKMKYSGHYLYNHSDNNTDYHIYDRYFGKKEDTDLTDNLQDMRVDNSNLNHRFSSKYEYQITPGNYLLLRPAIAYQKKYETAYLSDYTVTPLDTALLLNQETITDQYVARTSGEALFLHKLSTKGHVFVADARGSYIHTHEDIGMDFLNVQKGEDALQNTICKNTVQTYTYMASYIHPLGEKIRLKLDLGYNKTYGVMRRKTEIMANGAEEYSVDTLLSGSTWSNYGGLLANISYMMNSKQINLVAGTEFQKYDLYSANDMLYFKRSYKKFLPYVFMRLRMSRGQLHVQYKTTHQYPALAQVHDAINNANAVMAIRGNLRLEPAYMHSLMARLILPIFNNGSVIVFFTNLTQADNYIGSLRSLSSDSYDEDGERRNTEILSYKNTDGYFNWTSLFAYGVPVKALSSNINLSSRVSYAKIPGYWDNIKQFTSQWNWSGSLTAGSNISENVDFVLDVNSKYTSSKNLMFTDMNVNFWSLSYGGQLNWQFMKPLKLVVECGRTNYFGSGTSQFNAIISNIALAYKFLPGRKGELRFQINDVLNQDNSFYQTTTELYRREVNTNILGRYAMLTFTYNINTNKL